MRPCYGFEGSPGNAGVPPAPRLSILRFRESPRPGLADNEGMTAPGIPTLLREGTPWQIR